MNKQQLSSRSNPLNWGAFKIAGLYLLIGSLWILFSDRAAERMALNKEMLTRLSLYKGWGYVLVTALLLYWLIQRHTGRLQASEKQLQVVTNALPILISYIDKNQRYQFANEAYEEWFGEKAQGKHIKEVVGEVTYQKSSKYIDKVLRGETVSYETEIPDQDGGERFVIATCVPDIAANGQVRGFFTLVQDISEQKEAREKLRQWADAFEGCAHGIAIGDPTTNRIVVCNPAFANMHNCRVEDIVGASILSLYAPSDHERVRHHIERADQIGHARFETQMTRRGRADSVFPVQMDLVSVLGEDGELLYRVATAQDISERKRAEDVLRRFELLSQNSRDIILFMRRDDGCILDANAAAVQAYGYSRDELLGLTIADLRAHDTHSLTADQMAQADAGGILFETIHLRKDGNTFPVEVSSQGATIGGVRTLISIIRDITERKQAEEALQKGQRLLQDVIDNSGSLIYLLDLEGRFLLINRSLESVLGRPREEVIGRSRDRFLPPEIAAKHRANDVEVIQTHSPITMEEENNEPDGKHIYLSNKFPLLDQNGNLYGVGGISADITQRKQAEEALRNSQAQMTGIFDSAMDAIISTDADQRILIFNRAAEAMFRCDQSDALGQPLDRFIPERFREAHRRQVHNFGQTGVTNRAMKGAAVVFGRRINGDEFPCEASISQIDIAGKKIYTVVLRDVSERKQAEEELSRSEERYRYLFENNPHPMWIYDRKTLAFLDVNEAAIAKYGYSRQEFLNMTIVNIRPPEDIERLMNNLAQPRQPLERSDGWRHRLKDGTIIYVEITSHTVEIDGHESALVVAQDITERVQAQNAVRLKDDLLRLTSEMAKVGGWEFDSQTGKGTWTDEVARIHDLDPAQETNVELGLNFYAGESREKIEQAIKDAVELARPYDLELEMVSAKGNHKWVRTMALPIMNDGKVVKVQGIFQDITERKKIEDALQQAHAELELKVQERTAALSQANTLLQALMDTMPDQIYFKDRQSHFIRNSRSQANLLGVSDPAEVIGKTDFDFFPHAARAYAEEQEVMRSGKSLVDLEEWVVWPDGQETWVSTTKVPLRNSDGETIGIFGISRDITERKRNEQAIRQLNSDLEKQTAQLQAANKELEAFSYSVSHDLRAPLRAIDGYTRILVEDYEANLDAEGKRVCGIISAEARRMGQLIDDLLAFSRLGRKEIFSSTLDMKALVVSVLNELLKDEDRARIDFHIARLPSVSADTSLIRQVWVNLLSNAIKFTSKKERAAIEVGSKSSKDEIIYYVRDTGAGFDMEYANKLFGVFQRLHSESEFEGTGVGLAIVQRIIRRHDGRVWAEGEVDQGATFYFALPRKENRHE